MDISFPIVIFGLLIVFSLAAGNYVNYTQRVGARRTAARAMARGASVHHMRPVLSASRFPSSLDRDLIFWGLKVRRFFTHKTYAYFTPPISPPMDRNLTRNVLFESPLNGEIWTMAADYYAKRLYYTDHVSNFIGIYDLQTRTTVRTFSGLAWGIDSISVDWISGNIYWTDSNFDRIMVADRNLTYYRSVLTIQSRVPAKVAVHPGQRYIFWTEKREGDCRIYRSSQDGYGKRLLYKFDEVQTIKDIVIDFVNERLYWTERLRALGSVSRIRYINLRGRYQRKVYDVYSEKGTYFFGIASYKENLYLTDDLKKQFLVVNKNTNQVTYRYKFDHSEIPRGVTVFSAHEYPISKMDESHKCSNQNPCQQLCMARYGINQFRCECSTGFSIQPDGKSCRARMISDNFAILLDARHSKMFQLNLAYPVEPQQIQVANLSRPSSVAYDPETETVYWGDEISRTLSKASLSGDNQEILMSDVQVFSIALDLESRNMYWVDSLKDAVFVSNMEGAYKHTLHIEGLHNVWGMTIDSSRRYIYWSDWGQIQVNLSQLGVIKRSGLDGSNVEVVATTPGGNPHALTLDPKNNILFWTQINNNAIGWLNLENGVTGTYRMPLFWKTGGPRLPFPTGVAYWQEYLYVSDMSMKHVLRVSVRDVTKAAQQNGTETEVRPFGPTMFYEQAGIHAFDNSTRKGSTVCRNSNCPHLCLPDTHGNPKCVCQDYFRYIESNNSCARQPSADDTTPPSFGSTCPLYIRAIADECSNKAEVNFTEPTATDDSGLPVTMKTNVKIDKFPLILSEGSLIFTYLAIDQSHNVAKCRFRVDVIVRRCYHITLKEIPAEAELGEPSCGEYVGSIVNVTCPHVDGIAFQYKCGESTDWEAIGPETCDPQAFTNFPTPKGLTTSSSNWGPTGTRYMSPDKSARVPERTTAAVYENGDSHEKYLQTKSPDITGLTVGLIVSFVALIALGVAVFMLFRRWKAKAYVPRTNWTRADDQVQLTHESTESELYLGERDLSQPTNKGIEQ